MAAENPEGLRFKFFGFIMRPTEALIKTLKFYRRREDLKRTAGLGTTFILYYFYRLNIRK
jgi:hypothetical protein